MYFASSALSAHFRDTQAEQVFRCGTPQLAYDSPMLALSSVMRSPARGILPGAINLRLGLSISSSLPRSTFVLSATPVLRPTVPASTSNLGRSISTSCGTLDASNRSEPQNNNYKSLDQGTPLGIGRRESDTPTAPDGAPPPDEGLRSSSGGTESSPSPEKLTEDSGTSDDFITDPIKPYTPKSPAETPHAHGSAAEYMSQLRNQLAERTRKFRVKASERADEKVEELKVRAKELARRWNALSGYEEIEHLKLLVAKLEHDLHEHRSTLQTKRAAYVAAVSERSASQRQLSDLLGRKPSWTEQDLATYTSLLHSEHGQARHEKQAESAYNDAESSVQEAFDELMRAITQRYHEEHIWSDRMRLVSTWGSVAIAVLNAFIFIMALLVVEPYKRRKLANTLESRVVAGEKLNAERMALVIESFEKQIRDLRLSIETLDGDLKGPYPTSQPPPSPVEEPEPLAPMMPLEDRDGSVILTPVPDSESPRTRAGRAMARTWERHGELVVAGVVGATVALLGMAVGQKP